MRIGGGTLGPLRVAAYPSPWSQIQIQIQIESLHPRLDEIDEMTNAGGIPAGPFLSMCTMREPRAMLAASHSP